jgi:hypothetical protein
MVNMQRPRLTTAEVATILGCKNSGALVLLQAAGITFTRNTLRGPFFWDAGEVERLLTALRKTPTTDQPQRDREVPA